jgi:hypothetical protein
MAEEKVREKDFNLHFWFATIPMTDDVYLGLQAQNIARVEMAVLRKWESMALDELRADPGNYQGPKCRELMALSQMWVFAVYEFCAHGSGARTCLRSSRTTTSNSRRKRSAMRT